MFAKGMSNDQYKIYFQKLVFERMIEDIPSFINDEIHKLEDQIKKDAEVIGDGDTYTDSHCCTDLGEGKYVVEDFQTPIANNIARNDHRNRYIELLEEIPYYFYHAMVTMLWSYAEYSLKGEIKQVKTKKTSIEYLFDKIVSDINRSDLGCVQDVWSNVKVFSQIRNMIVHEGKVKENYPNIDQDFLRDNLNSIYALLKKTIDAIEEHNATINDAKRKAPDITIIQ